MNNLALSDEILLKIEKPVRYIGNEVNMVRKDPEGKIRFAMCFPDVYEIGMSHLGMKIIYDQMNRRDDVYCERVFSPWVDLDKVMREENIPLFALESQDPVFMFDFLAVTIQYEMCYTNILQILDLSQIGIYAKDRREDAPFVIGGGILIALAFLIDGLLTTQSLWRISLIYFISERVKPYIMTLWIYIKNIRRTAATVKNF